VDIPIGAVGGPTQGMRYDKTIWSVVADIANRRYYFRSMDNKNWRYVDLPRPLRGQGHRHDSRLHSGDYPDVTDQAKPLR
jgi:choloylglycine hydrolase